MPQRKSHVRMVEKWIASKPPGTVFLVEDVVAALSKSWNSPTRLQISQILHQSEGVERIGVDRSGRGSYSQRSVWMVKDTGNHDQTRNCNE